MEFLNKHTGLIETVTNEMVIEQYKKHTEFYVEHKPKKVKVKEEAEE